MSAPREWLTRVAVHPEDPEARLMGARALEAEDAPRAEFIRAQVRLAGRGLDPARRAALERRVAELRAGHQARWTQRLRALGASDLEFTRGFVEEAVLTEKSLAEHGAELLLLEPVRRLRLRLDTGEGLARAVAWPWFAQVSGLYLEGRGLAGAARALATSPHAGRLEFLVLSQAELPAVKALSESERLTSLRSLSLTGSEGLGDEAAGQLASTRLVLHRLYLTATGLSDEGAAALARARALQPLEVLALNRNALSDEGAHRLAASKTLVNLRRLELEGNELSAEGLQAFRSPKALPGLRQLRLRGMFLSDEELAPLRKRFGRGLRL